MLGMSGRRVGVAGSCHSSSATSCRSPNTGPQHWSPTKEAVAEEDEAADHRRVYFNFNLQCFKVLLYSAASMQYSIKLLPCSTVAASMQQYSFNCYSRGSEPCFCFKVERADPQLINKSSIMLYLIISNVIYPAKKQKKIIQNILQKFAFKLCHICLSKFVFILCHICLWKFVVIQSPYHGACKS